MSCPRHSAEPFRIDADVVLPPIAHSVIDDGTRLTVSDDEMEVCMCATRLRQCEGRACERRRLDKGDGGVADGGCVWGQLTADEGLCGWDSEMGSGSEGGAANQEAGETRADQSIAITIASAVVITIAIALLHHTVPYHKIPIHPIP